MIDTEVLRCNIIQQALSGNLSSHEDDDTPVGELLHNINGKTDIRQKNQLPYTIPSHWAWVKLSDLYTFNPKVNAEDNEDAAFIPMEKINPGFSKSFTFNIQPWKKASTNHTKFEDGDVAFAKISPCFENRKSFIAENLPNGIGGGTTELIVLRQPAMCKEYTFLIVLDQRFIHTGSSSYKGIVGQQRVKSDVIKNYFVPVPPFEEQERIVSRVEELFAVIDSLDDARTRYTSDVSSLKSKVIDAGIQGRLTEQLPKDGTAQELFAQIQPANKKSRG